MYKEHNRMAAMTLINFKLHPSFIHSAIKDQASGIDKAIAELVMNSLDAGATRVDIHVNEIDEKYHFTIKDNGKGFTQDTIENYFAWFGAPHDEGDAIFGKFRLGRGQIFNYASTEWFSNQFALKVDIEEALNQKSDTLGFDFDEVKTSKVKGCEIKGIIYEKYGRDNFSIQSFKENLKDIIEYIDLPVYFNGDLLNTPKRKIRSTLNKGDILFEDDLAYYILKRSADSFEIYNLGVRVPYTWYEESLLKGIIISKKPFMLTASRNEVIVDRCPIYKQIISNITNLHEEKYLNKFLYREVQKNEKKKKIIDESAAIHIIENIIKNKTVYDAKIILEAFRSPLFEDYKNRTLSAVDLVSTKAIMLFNEDYDYTKVEKIESKFDALIVDENSTLRSFLNNFYYSYRTAWQQDFNAQATYLSPLEQFLFIIKTMLNRFSNKFYDVPEDIHYSTAIESLVEDRKIFADNELTSDGKQYLNFLNHINDRLFELHGRVFNQEKRVIHLGEAPDAEAWTNNSGYIVFSTNTQKYFNEKQYLRLLLILIHEYCHKDSSEKAHDIEFYQEFHDFIIEKDLNSVLENYISASLASTNKEQICLELPKQEEAKKDDLIVQRLTSLINSPTHKNTLMLDALIKDMNLNFYAADNKTLFGVKYNTFRGWVTDPSSTRHRNPRPAVWNNFIYSLIAHRLGFKDTNAFLKLSMELPNEYGLSEGN